MSENAWGRGTVNAMTMTKLREAEASGKLVIAEGNKVFFFLDNKQCLESALGLACPHKSHLSIIQVFWEQR